MYRGSHPFRKSRSYEIKGSVPLKMCRSAATTRKRTLLSKLAHQEKLLFPIHEQGVVMGRQGSGQCASCLPLCHLLSILHVVTNPLLHPPSVSDRPHVFPSARS